MGDDKQEGFCAALSEIQAWLEAEIDRLDITDDEAEALGRALSHIMFMSKRGMKDE